MSPCFVVPAVVAIASLLGLIALAWDGWPGTAGVAGLAFCEASRAGIVKQPANTYSNLGFMIVGLAIGWVAARDGVRQYPPWQHNRMRSTVFYPTLYATVATFLCPGSMAMHASTTAWGGKLDVFSMFLWVAFPVAYGITRLRDLSIGGFLAAYVALVLFLGVYVLIDVLPGTPLFGVLLGVFSAIEVAVFRRIRDLHARRVWWAVAALAFAVAFGIWVPSHTGGPWCSPSSLIQGHAAWHLLCSVAVAAIYLFYRSEQPEPCAA